MPGPARVGSLAAGRSTLPVQAGPQCLAGPTGNLWEWYNDWYEVDYSGQSPVENPRGPAEGRKKVLRGGAFSCTPESCSSWTRYCDEPGFTDACVASDDYGFRCVRKAVVSISASPPDEPQETQRDPETPDENPQETANRSTSATANEETSDESAESVEAHIRVLMHEPTDDQLSTRRPRTH